MPRKKKTGGTGKKLPKKRDKYSCEFKQKWVEAFEKSDLSMCEFSEKFGIKKQNLSRWIPIYGKLKECKDKRIRFRLERTNCKRQWQHEEDQLYAIIKEKLNQNKLITTPMIKEMFFALFTEDKRKEVIEKVSKGRNWCCRFMERYHLSLRKNTVKDSGDFNPDNQKTMNAFYEYWELKKLKIEEFENCAIINMDETFVHYEPVPGKCVAEKGAKDVKVKDAVNPKQGFTGVVAISKSGETLKPMAILPNLVKVPFKMDDCHVEVSQTGKMNRHLMKEWYDNSLVPYLDSKNIDKCLLICDQYGSHKTRDVVEYMERVELLLLPPTTTSFLQPLDVNIFSQFKSNLSQEWCLEKIEQEKKPKLAQRRKDAVKRFAEGVKKIPSTTIKKSFDMCGLVKSNEEPTTGLNRTLESILN